MERVAVVTGGTGALGRWVVRELVEEGWRVDVPARSPAGARDLADFLEDRADAVTVRRVDLTDPPSVDAWMADVTRDAGRLDALCGVAGGFAAAPLEATGPDVWGRMMGSNATSAFLAARAAVPWLRASGRGRIVHVASADTLHAGPGKAAYAAAKAAVVSLTRSLARELAGDGVTVNALALTTLDTEANRAAMPRADPSLWVRPREVARVLAFLLGDDAAAVTGSVLEMRRG